jgi:anthranilate phosphoribosyltransferase
VENAALIRGILSGQEGAPRDAVVVNAAAALVASGVAANFREGASQATAAISSGTATEKLNELSAFTQKNLK